jgi:hypothetical protein
VLLIAKPAGEISANHSSFTTALWNDEFTSASKKPCRLDCTVNQAAAFWQKKTLDLPPLIQSQLAAQHGQARGTP